MSNTNELKLKDVFYSLQGEGPFAGWPAVFIRMSGCNMTCDFCDTDHSIVMKVNSKAAWELAHHEANGRTKLVVITGGEPFLQDLEPLVTLFLEDNWIVQIESNGTIVPEDGLPWDEIHLVVSPKDASVALFPQAKAVKYVLRKGEIPSPGQIVEGRKIPIYVQPIDDKDEVKNRENLIWCRDLALSEGWRLSLQVQKIINVR
jgi:organic radical activating enzyme